MDRALCSVAPSLPSSSLLPPLRSQRFWSPPERATRRTLVVVKSVEAEAEAEGAPPPAAAINTELLLSRALDAPPASLISYANIQKSLSGEALLTPDYYATLGLAPSASYQEVATAFRRKCESILQQGLNEEEIRNELRILKVSYDILSSEEERRLYDWSLFHSQSPGGIYRWPYEADITQSTCAPGPPKEPEDEEGIRRVGYFFLGWFVLAFILNLLLR